MNFLKKVINYGYYSYYGISNSFNIIRLLCGITTFIGYSKITGKYSDRLLNNLFYLININGYIVIKFTQWLTSRMLLMETDKDKIEVLKFSFILMALLYSFLKSICKLICVINSPKFIGI